MELNFLMEKNIPNEARHGTTTVGIVFDKGVVLAADKRATYAGLFIASKNADKIVPVGDKLALTTAGASGDADLLARTLRAELELFKYGNGRELTVEGASTLMASFIQGGRFFLYPVGFLLGGVDSDPHLFSIDGAGGVQEEKYSSEGSGMVVAFGILDEFFKEGMSEDQAIKVAVKAVNASMRRDTPTGDGLDCVVITKAGTKRLSKPDVESYLSQKL